MPRKYVKRTKLSKDKVQDRKIAKLSRQINTKELKIMDFTGVGLSPTYNGAIYNLFSLAQGVQDNQRIGDKVSIHKIEFRWNLGYTAATLSSNQFRIILLREKSNAIGTTPSNVFQGLGTVNAAQGPLEEDTNYNMRKLYDRSMVLDTVTKFSTMGKYVKSFKRPMTVQFINNSTTILNGIVSVAFVTDAAVTNLGLDFYCRCWYSDL